MAHDPIPAKHAAHHGCGNQDERRAQHRLRCKGVAEIRVFPCETRLSGTLIDLSVSGCCIETATPLPAIENPCVEVHLRVKGFSLRIAGVVRNLRDGSRIGIEFVDITSRKVAQVQELLADLAAMETAAARETATAELRSLPRKDPAHPAEPPLPSF